MLAGTFFECELNSSTLSLQLAYGYLGLAVSRVIVRWGVLRNELNLWKASRHALHQGDDSGLAIRLRQYPLIAELFDIAGHESDCLRFRSLLLKGRGSIALALGVLDG